MALNDARIRAAKPGDKDRWLNDGNGLYLRIRAGGSKTFVLRSKRNGKTRIRTLGRWPEYTLKKARLAAANQAAAKRGHVLESVEDVIDEWRERVVRHDYKRPHHVEGYIDRALIPELGNLKIDTVTPRQVADMLRQYSARGPIAGNRLYAITRRFFNYAVEAGYIEASPAAGLSRRVAGGPEQHRDRVLTDDEIRAVWGIEHSHGDLLRFLLLTGQRIGEGRQMRWTDVRGDKWHIPAEVSKNGKPHMVHLSPPALEILRKQTSKDRVFPIVSATAIQAWVRRWCAREKIDPAFVPHDLRRTFSTRAHDLGVAPHIVEKCLNHTLQGVMAVYNHATYESECAAAWIAWANELRRIVTSRS